MNSKKSLFRELENESRLKKLGALFLCVKTPKSNLKPYHILAEKVDIGKSTSQKQLDLFQPIPETDLTIDDEIPDDVFVMMSLPMLPFIAIGYLLTLFQGDLILQLLARFM